MAGVVPIGKKYVFSGQTSGCATRREECGMKEGGGLGLGRAVKLFETRIGWLDPTPGE